MKILEVSDFLNGPFYPFFPFRVFGILYRHVKKNSMREFRHWGCAQGPCRYAVQAGEDS